MATNQPEIQQKVADMGGLECIVTALKVHKGDEMVVGNALTAIQILCSYDKVENLLELSMPWSLITICVLSVNTSALCIT